MKSLIELIYENKSHLRKLYVEINEELIELYSSNHAKDKNKANDFYNLGGIKISEIRKFIESIDDDLVNLLLNKTIIPNKSSICLSSQENNKIWLMVVFVITEFDNNSFEYSVKIITNDRLTWKPKFKFTDIVYERINNSRPKRIQP